MGLGKPESGGDGYILGSKSVTGFWYYYFVVLFFKTPIPVILCFLFFLWSYRKRQTVFFEKEFVFLTVMAWFLIYFNFFYNSQVGIRAYYYDISFVICTVRKIADWLCTKKILVSFLALYSVATFYFYFPNLIAYSNEFLLPKGCIQNNGRFKHRFWPE